MTVCGGWSLVSHEEHGARAITMFCRSWQCDDCRPFRLSALKHQATDGNPTTFLTLTVNPATGQSPEDRARELVSALKVMIKRARRRWKKAPVEYLAVFEETKRGEPHLHLLMRAPFIPQKWLSRTMDELIKAPVVDIRRVGSMRGVARYVAKYVAKGPRSFGTLKRYWSTPNYAPRTKTPALAPQQQRASWAIVREPLWWLFDCWTKRLSASGEWVSKHEIFVLNGPAARASPARGSG